MAETLEKTVSGDVTRIEKTASETFFEKMAGLSEAVELLIPGGGRGRSICSRIVDLRSRHGIRRRETSSGPSEKLARY